LRQEHPEKNRERGVGSGGKLQGKDVVRSDVSNMKPSERKGEPGRFEGS